ncbi:DegV family protein [Paenibacillus crassostreae]|uniref:Fatty acid-binding protein DegV n=1 Tax=Paenibacillus crassostreae TaxID=1763538 RepID=A0A167G298_9BACL|nr:DegV family protein [Paenibacillus crassostreae]AOZ93831.1 fatty acid-binding protein DegV [Paenibacillus crassostreae]OAB77136.1 fatty acid-binding protein DegV [Paenibacillus crassostreae]
MPTIKIFTDSTSDLPIAWIEQHKIGIVPLYVVFGDQSLKDGLDITPVDLYNKVSDYGFLPKTAAPSPSDFIKAFAPYIEQGEQILFISLSSELSSTYQNAVIAAEDFPSQQIAVFDSLNLSSAIGLLVMKAVHAAEAGRSLDEIITLLHTVRPEIEAEFVVDTLEYLYKGGRCSGMQNLIGSMLKIRPIIKVADGKMTPAYRVRGKREKALDMLLQNAINKKDLMDQDIIFVVHSLAEKDALNLQENLQKHTQATVALSTAGCVICSHCGPQTIGIMYSKKP